jgi:hypothetical protein
MNRIKPGNTIKLEIGKTICNARTEDWFRLIYKRNW